MADTDRAATFYVIIAETEVLHSIATGDGLDSVASLCTRVLSEARTELKKIGFPPHPDRNLTSDPKVVRLR